METRFSQSVDVLENATKTTFQPYLKSETPVVLRGLWKNYEATTLWTPQYFRALLKNYEVGVFDGNLTRPDRSFKKPDYYLGFDEYIDKITSNEPYDIRLFLFNILKVKPELRKHFDFPPITKYYFKHLPFMFFGGKNAVVRLHQDMDWANVFLTQLHGRKEVVLFHPRYSKLLYRYPFNVHSAVDIENPDYSKFPGLHFVEGYRVILEPGDTLFMPSGYWHYIKYLEGGYAINQRALSPYPMRWLNGMANVAIKTHIDELMRWLLNENWFKLKNKLMTENAQDELKKIGWA